MSKIINDSSIAILLGVYNGEPFLKEQIDSLLNQSFRDWTLFIRDDFSTDKTQEIIKEYCNKYSFIVQVKDEDGNLGCNGNYFRLLEEIDSKYYMFCNADDFWFSNKIAISFERVLEEEKKNPSTAIIVHTDLSISDKNLNIISDSYWEDVNTDPKYFKTYNLLGVCNICAGATMLFNKKAKELTFPLPKSDSIFFDHLMALRIADKGIISTIYVPTMAYRQIGTNLAAVSLGDENSVVSKMKNFKQIINSNKIEIAKLEKAEWGGTFRYLFYKMVALSKIRFGKKYKFVPTNNPT